MNIVVDKSRSMRSSVDPSAMSEVAIDVRNLSKDYHIYSDPLDTLKEIVTGKPRHRKHWAIKDVSFKVRRGEILGLIGPNGAGKSTLLKMIAGTLVPSSGTIDVHGKLSAILELGTGFHPDYTGRENVITGGMCLGMSRDEVEARLPWVISFSELAHVIDQPFKTYSSGMQARLTFSTAISINPEILIIDEALAAGDGYFVAKSFARIREICRSGATVLFVSHGTSNVTQLCHKAIWLEDGTIRLEGDARDVATAYDYETHLRFSGRMGKLVEIAGTETSWPKTSCDGEIGVSSTFVEVGDKGASGEIETSSSEESFGPLGEISGAKIFRRGPILIDRVRFFGRNDEEKHLFHTWEPMTVEVEYRCEGDLPSDPLGFAVAFERERDMALIGQTSTMLPSGRHDFQEVADGQMRPGRRGVFRFTMPSNQMLDGIYLFSIGLLPNYEWQAEFYEYHHRVYRIAVMPTGFASGAAFYPHVLWKHEIREP